MLEIWTWKNGEVFVENLTEIEIKSEDEAAWLINLGL